MKRLITLTTIFILTTSVANAGLVESLGIGAKETAQAKAVAAQADTPFAIYYNPAGITQLDKPTIAAGSLVYDAQVYSKNFRLVASENGARLNPDGSVAAPIMKGDIINDGWETGNSTDNDPIVNPSLGFVLPITDRISFGIAAYAPYGLHIESNHNPYENPISFYAWESLYARKAVTPTIGYKINDKLSVGFGVSLGQSESDAGKTYRYNPFKLKTASAMVAKTTEAYIAGGMDPVQAKAKAKQDISAYLGSDLTNDETKKDGSHLNELQLDAEDDFNTSWNMGVLYKPTEKLSLGLTYRSRAAGDFEGDVLFTGTKIGTVTMDYDHPESVQGGVRYAFSKKFSVEFDLTWTRWSINEQQVEKINITNKDATIDPAFRAKIKAWLMSGSGGMNDAQAEAYINSPTTEAFSHNRDWDDTFQYQIGAEWLISDKLSLRGGFIYDPTPVPDSTFDQGWPDTDRTSYALGMGYKINDSWHIDAVFQYILTTPARDVKGDSDELNLGINETMTQGGDKVNTSGDPLHTDVYLDDNEGVLLGAGITVSYKF